VKNSGADFQDWGWTKGWTSPEQDKVVTRTPATGSYKS
jgi:hypothetical protein